MKRRLKSDAIVGGRKMAMAGDELEPVLTGQMDRLLYNLVDGLQVCDPHIPLWLPSGRIIAVGEDDLEPEATDPPEPLALTRMKAAVGGAHDRHLLDSRLEEGTRRLVNDLEAEGDETISPE